MECQRDAICQHLFKNMYHVLNSERQNEGGPSSLSREAGGLSGAGRGFCCPRGSLAAEGPGIHTQMQKKSISRLGFLKLFCR